MPKTLYYKLFVGYFLFGVFSLLFVLFISTDLANDSILKSEKDRLQIRGAVLTEDLATSTNPEKTIKNYARILESVVWIVSDDGTIILSSDDSSDAVGKIENFNPDIFSQKEFLSGYFMKYLGETSISVLVSEVNISGTHAYLIMHRSMSLIHEETESLFKIAMFSLGVVFFLSFVILIIFTIFVYRPIKQISHAATEFAKGNLQYKVLVVNTDDELGKLAASLNYMASQLKNLEDDQKKFIANISHDFRSPLTSIKGYIEAMKDGTIPRDSMEKYLDTVLFETNRLNKLTKNLLTINAWEKKENRLDLSDFNIKTEIKHVIETLEVLSNKKKILFDTEFKTKYSMVCADKEKVEQVLYNLIDNAIKFSNISSVIYITVYDKGEKIYISVKDTGSGISADNLPKIFDRFYKLDTSRGKDKTGTGLGLSIAKEILHFHNESITVISTEGAGTEFVFTLKKSRK